MLWGFAFVAQKSAMDFMSPFTFIGARYLLGGLVILPFALREFRRRKIPISKINWLLIALLSANFLIGSWLQQTGLLLTTVTNGGFLTGFYVFFVPLIMLVVFRNTPHFIVWICAPLALLGLYLLNGATLDQINSGDIIIIFSAIFWALHVLLLGLLALKTGLPIFISCVSFLSAGALAELASFIFENPTLADVSAGWLEIAYAGIFSTAIAFTLQAIGQMHVPPANAAIILSGEALFAAIGGAIIMGDRLPPIGYLGAAIIFTSIILVETVPAVIRRQSAS